MPVTLVDRLPLPSLKVYTASSVLLLSMATYHAISVTGDPAWRLNATLQRQDAATTGDAAQALPALTTLDAANGTRNITEQFVDVMTFMMQEPLCMWTVINMAYCALALFGFALQRLVFGTLRVAEAQRVRDKFWNYVFYKFIFVFGVLNVQYMDEVLLWCSWFTLVGFLHLLAQLCKDRFEYLWSSPAGGGWAGARLAALVTGVAIAAGALLGGAAVVAQGLPQARDTFTFMAAECLLVMIPALHVLARYALQLRQADAAGPLAYYTHLGFDACALVVELSHVVHMVVFSNLLVSMPSLVLLMQLRHLLHELQARLRRHRLYTALATHMSQNYPMASREEVEKNQDNCAICWEPMKEARKLPCSHLFHNSCLCQWVQQDASCPTCRRALQAPSAGARLPAAHHLALAEAHAHAHAHQGPRAAPLPSPNHLFHFDGSRYVSWLPSFSVEVTRVRAPPPSAAHLDAMARQVQQMFPHYSLSALATDLAATRSADLTVENILEGRLPPPPEPSSSGDEPAGSSSAAERLPAATSTSGLPPTAPPSSPAEPVPRFPVPSDGADAGSSGGFSKSASERETTLQRRKEQLVAEARRKYLQRHAEAAGRS